MDKTFADWMDDEMKQREWSRAELSRRSGLSQSMLSHIYTGTRNPGPDACAAIATAFRLPIETVMRAAGLLPQVADEELAALEEFRELVANMTPEERKQFMEIGIIILGGRGSDGERRRSAALRGGSV